MKHAKFLVLLALLLLMVIGCAPTATPPPDTATPDQTEVTAAEAPAEVEEAPAWEVVLQKELEQPARMAAFLNEEFGLTGGPGDPGKASYTTDGGQTWPQADSSLG
jgi:hypothetical protein